MTVEIVGGIEEGEGNVEIEENIDVVIVTARQKRPQGVSIMSICKLRI
jgi:hypothetical protein